MIVENHASFTVSSTTRTAAEVTRILGLDPTTAHEIGDARLQPSGAPVQHPPFEWDRSVWNLSADHDGTGDDQSGTSSLASVVTPLTERVAQLDQLRADCQFRLSWWGDSDSSQGGLVLPEELLPKLASLRCSVFMTSYFSEDVGV